MPLLTIRPEIPTLYEKREDGSTSRSLCYKCHKSINQMRSKLFWDINHWAIYCTCGTYNKLGV